MDPPELGGDTGAPALWRTGVPGPEEDGPVPGEAMPEIGAPPVLGAVST
jgi:hypothetical protein